MLLRDDYRMLERYRYLIAIGGILLLLLPRAFSPVNGAYLSIQVGSLSVQPAEFAKIAIVIFLASYLRDTRQLLVTAGRRVAGVTIPPLKHFGPMLVIWGASMLLLFYIRDIGSSVMFFGAFLAMIYVATDRLSFVVVGVVTFALGAYLVAGHIGHIADRIDAWQDPFDPDLLDRAQGGSYQLAQGSVRAGRRRRARPGLRPGGAAHRRQCATATSTVNCSLLPAPHTDFIYAVIVNELGLAGAAGLLCVYLLFVQRGFKIAMLARDSFSKLLATGLTCGLRAAGVRHRRRRHEADPADRRHAAVRQLRRLVGAGELRAAGVVVADLRPRASRCGAAGVNKPINRLFLVALLMFGALLVVDVVVDGAARR